MTNCPKCGQAISAFSFCIGRHGDDSSAPNVRLAFLPEQSREAFPGAFVLCLSCNDFMILCDDGSAREPAPSDFADLDPRTPLAMKRIAQWLKFTPEDEARHVAGIARALMGTERCSIILDTLGLNAITRALASPSVYRNGNERGSICPQCFEGISPVLSLLGIPPSSEGPFQLIVCRSCASVLALGRNTTVGPLRLELLQIPRDVRPLVDAMIAVVKNSRG